MSKLSRVFDKNGNQKCNKCLEFKQNEEFGKDKQYKFGIKTICKKCSKSRLQKNRKVYREKNLEKVKEKDRKYYYDNIGKRKNYREKYYKLNKEILLNKEKERRIKNPEKYKEKHKQQYTKYREKILAKNRETWKKNKEKYRETDKKWRNKNREKLNTYNREYNKLKKNDPEYQLKKIESTKRWQKNNPDKMRQYSDLHNEKRRQRYKQDPEFREKDLKKRKENYKKNKDQIRKKAKINYYENIEKFQEKDRKRYKRDRIKRLKNCKDRRIKIRKIVLTYYSNSNIPQCKCCDNTFYDHLTLDHINGGGTKHIRENVPGKRLDDYLFHNKFPKGYQILCMSCNKSKGSKQRCIHKRIIQIETLTEKQLKNKKEKTKMKLRVMNNYSSKPIPSCECCKEIILDFLEIDHVNNDGYKYRTKNSDRSNFYGKLVKNNFPSDPELQILCSNCNFTKAIRGSCNCQSILPLGTPKLLELC